jgi:hypothetical protein
MAFLQRVGLALSSHGWASGLRRAAVSTFRMVQECSRQSPSQTSTTMQANPATERRFVLRPERTCQPPREGRIPTPSSNHASGHEPGRLADNRENPASSYPSSPAHSRHEQRFVLKARRLRQERFASCILVSGSPNTVSTSITVRALRVAADAQLRAFCDTPGQEALPSPNCLDRFRR